MSPLTPGSGAALPGQFLLAAEIDPPPAGWRTDRLRTLTLAASPGLAVTPLEYPGSGRCAWLIGRAVLDSAMLEGQPGSLPVHPDGPLAAIGDRLGSLAGGWVAVVDLPGARRMYLDPGGSRPVVYSSKLGRAASTPLALDRDGYEESYDRGLAAALEMPSADNWYPAGLTAHRGIERLLPNHYLDLDDWRARRHRSPAATVGSADPADVIPEITAIVADTLRAVAARRELSMTLTAGRDTRMLLACARDVVASTEFFTFAGGSSAVDVHVARRLAGRLGLRLRELPVRRATGQQSEEWLRATGHCVSGAIREIHPTLAQLDPCRTVITGMAGEVGRAYLWRGDDVRRSAPFSAEELLERLALPAHPRLVTAVGRWLEGLADLPPTTVLDLAYVELRLGCWAGPQGHGQNRFGEEVWALSHARIFELVIGLSADYRREQRLATDVCRHAWPDVLSLPYNRYSGPREIPRRSAVAARRLARLPKAARRSSRIRDAIRKASPRALPWRRR